MKRARNSLPLSVIVLSLAQAPAFAEPGTIGFSLEVSVDGFFSPTLARAEITRVEPGSPAQLAGLLPGDVITQIADCKIPGCPGDRAKALLSQEAGHMLSLVVLRDGTEKTFTIRLAAKAH